MKNERGKIDLGRGDAPLADPLNKLFLFAFLLLNNCPFFCVNIWKKVMGDGACKCEIEQPAFVIRRRNDSVFVGIKLRGK